MLKVLFFLAPRRASNYIPVHVAADGWKPGGGAGQTDFNADAKKK